MVDTSLYIFNPDHDMALANCDPNYMAPAAARRLAMDVALLPIWYARSLDFVLGESNYNQAYPDEMRKSFPQLPSLLTAPEVAGKELMTCRLYTSEAGEEEGQ
mgnify:CR=1 FL=1